VRFDRYQPVFFALVAICSILPLIIFTRHRLATLFGGISRLGADYIFL
jgi:hypothetical protein